MLRAILAMGLAAALVAALVTSSSGQCMMMMGLGCGGSGGGSPPSCTQGQLDFSGDCNTVFMTGTL